MTEHGHARTAGILPACASVSGAVRRAALCAACLLGASAVPSPAQMEFPDQPLLASGISEKNVEMRGRWVRQWTNPDGELVLVYNGGFRLDFGQRRLAAHNAVVWIAVQRSPAAEHPYYELIVYLAEEAEVLEPGGTFTRDDVLLVRGLRTRGQIIKHQDAHAPENLEGSPLYQQALSDRLALSAATELAELPPGPEVHRPQPPAPQVARRQRLIRYRVEHIEPVRTPADEPIYIGTGGVYFAQDGGPDAPVLEIRAATAVIFPRAGAQEGLGAALEGEAPAAQQPLVPKPPLLRPGEAREPLPPGIAPPGIVPPPPTTAPAAPAPAPPQERPPEGPLGLGPQEDAAIRAIYLEGDVVLSFGNRFIRATRLYYDFELDRALILDSVLRVDIPERGIPLYVRAAEIRQLSAREFSARNARVTTSEFYTPHYHVGAERVYLRDTTPRSPVGQPTGPLAGQYEMWNTTLNVGGVPLLWWPYSRGMLEETETLIRRLSTGYSGRRGFELETSWYLLNLLGIRKPEGVDATLKLDVYGNRGPAIGIDADYNRPDYYGLFRSYFIYDDGEDRLGPLREGLETPPHKERGWALWRHKHFLPDDWQIWLEAAYISDYGFLEEWFPDEWFEGKERELAIYLKRAKGVQAIDFLANWRPVDFVTQTEHLPELIYRRIGDTFLDPLVLYHESRIGNVRYRPEEINADNFQFQLYEEQQGRPGPLFERNYRASDTTFRTDARQEAEWPFKLGTVSVVPFATLRGSYWDGQPRDDGSLWRGLGMYGVRGGQSFSRVYDGVASELFDIHRLRHIINPELIAYWGHSNTRSENITPFDWGVETIDPLYGFAARLHQLWQTKRGPEAARQTVDLFVLNLELGLFGNTEGRNDLSNGYTMFWRPENSRARNYFAGDAVWHISDGTSVLYDFNFDLNDGSFDRHNIALAIERDPRLAYLVGLRHAGDIDMTLVGGGINYRLTEKYITALRSWFDIDTGRVGEITLSTIRRLPRWYVSMNLEYDQVDDDLSITFSIWPEGIPEWTLGSRPVLGTGAASGTMPGGLMGIRP